MGSRDCAAPGPGQPLSAASTTCCACFRFHLSRSIYQLRRWWVDETVPVSLGCRLKRERMSHALGTIGPVTCSTKAICHGDKAFLAPSFLCSGTTLATRFPRLGFVEQDTLSSSRGQSHHIPETGCVVEYRGADKLTGKKALITAGVSFVDRHCRWHDSHMTSSVIAFATAIVYAREGADVTIVSLPDDKDDSQETKNAIEKKGRSCLVVRGNVMSVQACEDAVRQHVSKFGHVDTLVNNSSKHTPCDGPLNIDLSMVYSVFHGEVLPIFAMTRYALPHMNEGSSIINTTFDYLLSQSTIIPFTSF